ncbi:unnamed protein product [Adineta steineri]|uniref:Uncharacterized protein n=1 Tax=Adineta steineri TaxID=433720 RepID=A0A813N7H7_9BILA|nr:unnamed protein product [Adineta steineri]CAF0733027.1 unnamed protein product [Adineta steineri]CAF3804295.1 unnamed protein product [Adineta steineri]
MTKAILFVLLLISIYQINASIPLSTLTSDAKELTSLTKEVLNIPAYGNYFKQYRVAACNYMKKCCPSLRSNYFSIFSDGELDSKCRKHESIMVKGSSGVQCLRSKKRYDRISADPIGDKAAPFFSEDKQTVEYQTKLRETMEKVCSKTELEHYVCYFDDLSKHESCNLKILQKVSEADGTKYYKQFIQRWKTSESRDNQKLKKYFSKH